MPKHILIIDDSEDVRFLLSLKLNNLGYKISEAKDGPDALRFISEFGPEAIDLILLDLIVLELSDDDLLENIIEKTRDSECKIACLTFHYNEEMAKNFKILGASDVIKKPIAANELEKRINTILCGQ